MILFWPQFNVVNTDKEKKDYLQNFIHDINC